MTIDRIHTLEAVFNDPRRVPLVFDCVSQEDTASGRLITFWDGEGSHVATLNPETLLYLRTVCVQDAPEHEDALGSLDDAEPLRVYRDDDGDLWALSPSGTVWCRTVWWEGFGTAKRPWIPWYSGGPGAQFAPYFPVPAAEAESLPKFPDALREVEAEDDDKDEGEGHEPHVAERGADMRDDTQHVAQTGNDMIVGPIYKDAAGDYWHRPDNEVVTLATMHGTRWAAWGHLPGTVFAPYKQVTDEQELDTLKRRPGHLGETPPPPGEQVDESVEGHRAISTSYMLAGVPYRDRDDDFWLRTPGGELWSATRGSRDSWGSWGVDTVTTFAPFVEVTDPDVRRSLGDLPGQRTADRVS